MTVSNTVYQKFLTLCALAAFILAFPFLTSAATFNTDIQDHPTLLLTNYTKNPGCTTCWSPYVTADPGDTISFLIYYHNTSSETAQSTRLRVLMPTSGFLSGTIIGQIITRDGTGASSNATLVVPSKQVLSFIPDSVRWYPEQTVSPAPPEKLLGGQTGSEILNPAGLYISDLAPGWASQGHFIFRAKLKNDADVSAPTVVTKVINGAGQYFAMATASVNSNNADTKAWIEWGVGELDQSTVPRFVGSGTYNYSISELLSGTRRSATHFYRVVAENKFGKSYGETLSFQTDAAGNALVSYMTPFVTTASSQRVSYSEVIVSGSVRPQGNITEAWFEWGTTPALGIQTPSEKVAAHEQTRSLSHAIKGLSAERTYYYRMVAENPRGKVFGTVLKFTTPPFEAPSSQPGRSILPGSVPTHEKTISPAQEKNAPPPGQKPDLSFAAIIAALDSVSFQLIFAALMIITALYFFYRLMFRHPKPL